MWISKQMRISPKMGIEIDDAIVAIEVLRALGNRYNVKSNKQNVSLTSKHLAKKQITPLPTTIWVILEKHNEPWEFDIHGEQ